MCLLPSLGTQASQWSLTPHLQRSSACKARHNFHSQSQTSPLRRDKAQAFSVSACASEDGEGNACLAYSLRTINHSLKLYQDHHMFSPALPPSWYPELWLTAVQTDGIAQALQEVGVGLLYSPDSGSLPIIKTLGKFITISCWRTSYRDRERHR